MASRNHGEDTLSIWRLSVQMVLIVLAIGFWSSPFLAPLKLLVVLLHEMSHGLMALATGGAVEEIIIAADETGACRTSGGHDLLIVSAGYLGSMFFGGLILVSSRSRQQAIGIYAILALLLFGAAMSVIQDEYSRNFAVAAAGVALVLAMFSPGLVSTLILRGIGTVSCLYALIDIYNDTLSRSARELDLRSDASAFSELTGVHPATVGLAWLAVSVAYFLVTFRASLAPKAPASPRPRIGRAVPTET